jgi:heme/copper-type cytochrome/quinol oxidase subunit 3
MHCPITGINILRFLIATIAGFTFLFATDFVIHQHLLMDLYEQTKELWRPPEAMMSFFPLMLGSQLLMSAITAMIFTRNYEEKGIMEGVRFGFLLGLLFALMMSMSYVWMPIPIALAGSWGAAGLFQGLGLGIIFALTYRK